MIQWTYEIIDSDTKANALSYHLPGRELVDDSACNGNIYMSASGTRLGALT